MKRDQVIFDLIEKEHQRQLKGIELIASENFVSDEVMELADVRLKLPMRGGAESLNAAVAAGIMMYELTRTLPGK